MIRHASALYNALVPSESLPDHGEPDCRGPVKRGLTVVLLCLLFSFDSVLGLCSSHAGTYFAGFPCCLGTTPGLEGLALFRLPSISFPYVINIITFCTGNTVNTS